MARSIKPIPEGYHSVTPYLVIRDAARAIEFYKQAFGATERMRVDRGDGKIMHAEVRIGDSPIMMCDEAPEMGARGPETFGGSPVMIHLYVEDVDAVFEQAKKAGAEVMTPLADQFYGDRAGGLQDPFGHVWWVASQKEEVSDDELRRRAAERMRQRSG
jgi:PhnB protein